MSTNIKQRQQRFPNTIVRVWTKEPKDFIEFQRNGIAWCKHVERLLTIGKESQVKVNVGLPQGNRYAVVTLLLKDDGFPTATNIRESYRSIRSVNSLNSLTDPAVKLSTEIVRELTDYIKLRQTHLEG